MGTIFSWWVVGGLVGWLVGALVDWLVGWGWLICRSVGRWVRWLFGWLVGALLCSGLVGWLDV